MYTPDGLVRKMRRTFDEAGHAHELTFCCHNRLPLLSKDRTRQWLVEALAAACACHHLSLWAYVIMPEHVHILFLPEDDNYHVAAVLKSIKQPVARKAVNFLRNNAPDFLEHLRVSWPGGRREYRFWQQGGGYDRNIYSADVAWASVEYIHNNPVRRGLADCAVAWPWSSARWYAGMSDVLLPMDSAPPDPPIR
jgi:putative transposase